jgi:small-conductance mechanosensitive channel
VEVFGVRLIGFNAENGRKLLLMLLFVAAFVVLRFTLNGLARLVMAGRHNDRLRFWTHQGINLSLALLLTLGVLSIWFDDPARLTTAVGLVTAGLAFALQKVVTSIAGYFVILRGRTFSVGDRIVMGGVRGDVIALGFIQTTIMEMGEPPPTQDAPPPVWVRSRQFTGRIVTVTNDKLFEEPVFNYSRDFPYLWEEMTIPITYKDDRRRAEEILLETAERHTVKIGEMSREALGKMHERYDVHITDLKPKVYMRLTDNWLELSVRFLATDHGTRELKDAMTRDILAAFDEAGIGIASATFDIVGLPPLRLQNVEETGRQGAE